MAQNRPLHIDQSDYTASPQRGAADLPGRVIGYGALRLADWLRVPWFLPEHFSELKLRETAEFLEAVGPVESYRFYRALESNRSTGAIYEFWKRACEEIEDNEPLAPGLYRGIRTIRVVEDELEWIEPEPDRSFNSLRCPAEAINFAVVRRRLSEGLRLDAVLERDRGLPARDLQELVRVLTRFQKRSHHQAGRYFVDGMRLVLSRLRERFGAEIRREIALIVPRVPQELQTVLFEATRFVGAVSDKVAERFIARGRQGFVADAHGALVPANIYLQRFTQRGPRVIVINRTLQTNRERIDDVLGDVATLYVSLIARGNPLLAEEFRESYFNNFDGANDLVLWQLFVVHSALRHLGRAFQESGQPDTAVSELIPCILQQLYRVPNPSVILVQGDDCARLASFAGRMSQMTKTKIFAAGDLERNDLSFAPENQITFERAIRGGESAVVIGSRLDQISVSRMRSICEATHSVPLVVRFPDRRTNQASNASSSRDGGADIPTIHVDPILSDAELVMYVLSYISGLRYIGDRGHYRQ